MGPVGPVGPVQNRVICDLKLYMTSFHDMLLLNLPFLDKIQV